MAAPDAYARRQFPGAAGDTTITTGISDSDLTATLTSASGWPTGTYTGAILIEFYSVTTGLTLEKAWAASLSGTTLTIHSGGRAADGTTAIAHAAGVGIRPIAGARDADEANKAAHETVGQITAAGQILVGDGANSLAAVQAKTSGQILVGDGSTLASVAVSGDATLSSAGAVTVAAGAITHAKLAAGAAGKLDPGLSDDTVSGLTMTATAGENVTIGQVVYMKSDGKFWLADADPATPLVPGVAVAAASISADASGTFLLRGLIRDDSTYNWTIGATLYLSGTPGAITATAPSGADDAVQVLGWAYSADIAMFDPQLVITVHT